MPSNHEPQVPAGMSDEEAARMKLLTTILASAVIVKAKSDGLGVTAAAESVGDIWRDKSLAEGKGEEYADAVREFVVRIGESMNRVGGDRLRAIGIPA